MGILSASGRAGTVGESMRGDEGGSGVESGEITESPRFLVISLLEALAPLPGGLADTAGSGAQDVVRETAMRILQDRLGLSGVGLFATRSRSRLAAAGIPTEVEEILWAAGPGGDSLVGRVTNEQRIFLIGRRSAEPCMHQIRQLDLDWQVLALVPLLSAEGVPAVLLLAAADGTILSRGVLDTLHPVFRFLAGSLSLPRDGEGDPPEDGAMPTVENLEVELEALRSRNAEVEDLLRAAGEASAAGEAAKRLEIENARVQIAELESSLAGARAPAPESPCETCIDLRQTAGESESRIAALEEDLAQFRLATEVAAVPLGAEPDPLAVSPPIDIEEGAAEAVALKAMAEAAFAELVGTVEEEVPDLPEALPGPVLVPEARKVATPLEPWVLCCAEGSSPMFGELSEFAGERQMPICAAEDSETPTGRRLYLVNLLVDDLDELVAGTEVPGTDCRLLGYAAQNGCGAALGEIGWLSSSLPTDAALAQIRTNNGLPKRTLLVSARLREMAPLREALTNEGSSVAMACDARQALDLLEIVQQPDAVILDLAVEGAAALALASNLYQENVGSGLQIFLLGPEPSLGSEFRADPAWSEVLRPFGIADLERLIAPWVPLS